MKEADPILRAVAAKDVTLTLIGESGSGKEVLARRAHELSERRRGPFVPIDCAAIPDALGVGQRDVVDLSRPWRCVGGIEPSADALRQGDVYCGIGR
ncbi:sigma 54-interacting transcriptional regulator [Sorangium sp. So ce1000]